MTLRVAVIGAGVVGLCLAEQLAVSGARVDLVEREAPGAGATTRSFAWINATFDKQPRSYYELSRDAVACWRRWSDADPALGVRWTGSVEWATGRGADDLSRALDRHRALGAHSRAIDAEELAELEPDVAADDLSFACATGEEAVVEPMTLVERLVERCRATGVRLRCGTSLARINWQDEWRLVLEEQAAEAQAAEDQAAEDKSAEDQNAAEELACDVLVLAAGTATQALARRLGCSVPLVPSPGVLVDVPAAGALRGVVLSPDVHFRSIAEGTLRAGLDFGGTDPGWSDEQVAAEVGRRVAERFPGVDESSLTFVRGERPMPRDGFPVVGRLPGEGALFVAVMHSGITLAPLVAELLATEIVSGRQDPRLADFRPARFVDEPTAPRAPE